jgi:hypothetical protein
MQVRLDIDTSDILIQELPTAFREDFATFAQDAAIAQDLAQYTLVGKIAASGKWKLYDPAAVDGSALKLGVYMGPVVAQADIVAGDVTDLPILYANARLVEGKLVIEGATTLETVIGATTVNATTVRDAFMRQGVIFQETEPISAAQR